MTPESGFPIPCDASSVDRPTPARSIALLRRHPFFFHHSSPISRTKKI